MSPLEIRSALGKARHLSMTYTMFGYAKFCYECCSGIYPEYYCYTCKNCDDPECYCYTCSNCYECCVCNHKAFIVKMQFHKVLQELVKVFEEPEFYTDAEIFAEKYSDF